MPGRNSRKLLRHRLIRIQQFPPCKGMPVHDANAFSSIALPVIVSAIQMIVETIRGR
jgi:hypothetical protein